jgi:hypothetical protein
LLAIGDIRRTNERFEERLSRFDVFEVDTGVADHRIGHRHDLTGIGGVRKNFLITGHRGVEDDFPNGFAFESMTHATKNTSVFKKERGAFR